MSRWSLTIGLAAMELCWIAPWAVLIGRWADPAHQRALLSAPSIFGLLLLAALSTNALGPRVASQRPTRVALVALGLVAVLLAVRLDQYPGSGGLDWLGLLVAALAVFIGQTSQPALAFALGLLLWWRGVRIGSQSVSFQEVEGAFRWGIGALVAFALVVGVTTQPSQLAAVEGDTTIFLVGFFFVSLVTLALGRLESLRTRARALAVNTQWLGVLILVAGAVVLLALLIGQILSFDVLFLATRPLFDVLGQVILVLLYIIIIPLAYIVELLIYAVLSLLQPGQQQQPPAPLEPADVDNALQRLLAQAIPPDLLVVLKAVGAAVLLAIALLVIARAVARWRPTSLQADATAEERDSLWEPGRLRALLIGWLRRLLRRRNPLGIATADLVPDGPAATDDQAVLSVRALYRELLRLGAAAGAARPVSATPLEHEPRLSAALAPAEPVAELTAAYLKARYADETAAGERVEALRVELSSVHPRAAADAEPD